MLQVGTGLPGQLLCTAMLHLLVAPCCCCAKAWAPARCSSSTRGPTATFAAPAAATCGAGLAEGRLLGTTTCCCATEVAASCRNRLLLLLTTPATACIKQRCHGDAYKEKYCDLPAQGLPWQGMISDNVADRVHQDRGDGYRLYRSRRRICKEIERKHPLQQQWHGVPFYEHTKLEGTVTGAIN